MNIIELAEKAGMTRRPADKQCRAPYWDVVIDSELERFAALALEEAAKVCEDLPDSTGRYGSEWDVGTLDCADAIRALKGAKE